MQLMKLLHTRIKKQLPSVHQVRLNNLFKASETLIRVNKLSLTALGRNLFNQNKTRSNIKKMDRLVSNTYLYNESFAFYKVMSSTLISAGTSPWIHIDWSCICSLTNLYLLRASLSMSGRSIVIYEECHPKKNENHHPTHKAFLKCLSVLLPATVKPVIVTDAGFRSLWFSEIRALDWDYVGRLRNKNLVCLKSASWQLSKELYRNAKPKPEYLGNGMLTQKLNVPAHFVLYKGKKKKRQKINKDRTLSKSGKSKRYAKSYAEPWLLVTSLLSATITPHKIVTIYRQRMRIEENIRDTKSNRYGFGLNESRTRTPKRMAILLLIGAIATLACWLASIIARNNGTASDFQAQSSKFKSALSCVYLGREALKKGIEISIQEFKIVMQQLIIMTCQVKRETHV